jgi:hypothetical protein
MSCKAKPIAFFLGCTLLAAGLAGCAQASDTSSSQNTDAAEASNTLDSSSESFTAPSVDDLFTQRDLSGEYDTDECIDITLSDSGSSCDSSAVSISENTITISDEGVYRLHGTLSDGQVIVDASKSKVQLVLDNAAITCTTSAAIYVKSADKVFVTLAADSSNTLCTNGEFTADGDTNVDAVIFSKDDLTLNGSGSLTVSTEYGHGIVTKDDLKITSGLYTVTASKHAICGKDSVSIYDGTFALTSGKDGITSNNDEDEEKGAVTILGGTFSIESGDDGIHAESDLIITDGEIDIPKCYEGLEGRTVTISGGTIALVASDDGINAAGGSNTSNIPMVANDDNWILICGGTLTIDASGDGIDSNGKLSISGGNITVYGPVSDGDSAIDYDGEAVITGGTLLASGFSGMAQGFSDSSTQCSILLALSSQTTGEVTVSDADGNELLAFTPSKTYSCIQVSSPDLSEGESYTITCGGESTTIEMTSISYGSNTGGFGQGFGGNRKQGGFNKNGDTDNDQNFNNDGNFNRDDKFDGQRPDGTTDGTMPDMTDGEMPEMPDGEMPEMPNGEVPEMPDGEMPNMPDGNVPDMPDGEMPQSSSDTGSQT